MLWLDSTKLNVKESTYARYYHLITHHILPNLGQYEISRISTALIEAYIHTLLTSGRIDGTGGLSAKTVSDILVILKSTFAYAKCEGHLVLCNLERISVKKEPSPLRILTEAERATLEKELLQEMDLYKFGILLSLYTGIRIGELCALKWKCFDFDAGVLHIQETMQRIQNTEPSQTKKTKVIITAPKSRCSVRCIPLPFGILELAARLRATPEAFVLTGKSAVYAEPRTMQNHFKKCLQQCGLEPLHYHVLRHTFATRCVELGFEIKSLSEILGHANVNITLNRYVHSSLELKKTNMDKLKLIV